MPKLCLNCASIEAEVKNPLVSHQVCTQTTMPKVVLNPSSERNSVQKKSNERYKRYKRTEETKRMIEALQTIETIQTMETKRTKRTMQTFSQARRNAYV